MKSVNSDQAYDFIRERILNGQYPPGSTLTTSQLALDIGLSRTPVRDALRQLESDGLVVIRAHYGASVRNVTFKEFRDMCDMRLALESYAAGFAATNHLPEEAREMGFALEAMRRVIDMQGTGADNQPLPADLVREDIRFHLAILAAAKNELIRKEIMRLHLLNRIVSSKGVEMMQLQGRAEIDSDRREVLAEHEAIYRAIVRRDSEQAKGAMHRHIQKLIDKQIALREQADGVKVQRPLTEEEMIYST